MDPRYQWPPQAYANGQYAPPMPPNGYHTNGYPPQYPPQQQMYPPYQQYPQSQPMHGQPQVLIPPRPTHQYPPMHNGYPSPQHQPQPGPMQPQVAMPPGNMNPSPLAAMNNPRIRQVQVPVQRHPAQMHRQFDGTNERNVAPPPQRPQQQVQTHQAKPVQRSVSYQENAPRPQQRTPSQPSANQNQHRTPLQPHSTPQQKPAASQPSSNQHRSPAMPQTPSSQGKPHPQVVIKKVAHSANAQSRPHASPKALPEDLSVMLLHAADEYINAARRLGPVASMAHREADLQQYYKLMATGLGCMEAVLKRYNQSPRDEAKLRLKYASLLVEETDHDVEIEEVLSKGIALCQRSRLVDLKYSMQHLQARYQFQTNHRAALKSLDAPISEAETFQHIVWVYAFRFLKVSLALQVPGRPETTSALQQLHAIASHAEKRGDRAIFVTASALEAMIHLRNSGLDHLEQAQRSIASARSYQLEVSTTELGQIAAFIDSIDIACSLQQGAPDKQKMAMLHQRADDESAPEDGVFSILIEKSSGGQNLTQFTGGVFTKSADGRDELVFSWLPKNDFKKLAYYLSGITTASYDVSRGVAYLQEGLKITQDGLRRPPSYAVSIPASVQQRSWLAVLHWHLTFTIGLMGCRNEDLPSAEQALRSLRRTASQSPFSDNPTFGRLLLYLSGVLEQTNGSFDTAISTYSLLESELPETGAHPDFNIDIAIIATMNRILVLRNPAHPEHYLTNVLFSKLEPLCANHPNHYIEAAFKILRALTDSDSSINRQKTFISNALSTSQKTQNYQFVAMILNYMSYRFFANTVGEQAIKSVRAARSVAKQSRSTLWKAVAYGLCVNNFLTNGLLNDAQDCQLALEELKDGLPAGLLAQLQVGFENGSGDVYGQADGGFVMDGHGTTMTG